MEVVVHSRRVDLSDSERQRIEDEVRHAVRVFPQGVERVDVEVSEETNPRRSDSRFVGQLTATAAGRVVRVESSAATHSAAIDDAVTRLTRQLRRLKERLITRNRQPEVVGDRPEPPPSQEVVKVKQFILKPMTIEEAALQMEMLDHSFFFFLNADTEDHNVLYRRRDGRLGLIEPA